MTPGARTSTSPCSVSRRKATGYSTALAYTTAATFTQYAPRCRFLELIVDGDYRGVYLLVEKVKRGKDRVDVGKLRDDDLSGDGLTGGYIVELPLIFTYPRKEDIRPEQARYIEEWLGALETALASERFADPEVGYPTYIDVDSYFGSTFVWKDRDSEGGKLHAGPV